MNEEMISKLQEYSFSEKESKIYLVMLELGTCIASTISRKTWINRTTVYTVLEDLKRRWVISEMVRNDVKYYSAANPESILAWIEKKAESFKLLLPELLNINSKYWNKAKIKYYDGLEWVKGAYYEVLNEGYNMIEPYLSIYWVNDNVNPEIIRFFEEEFVAERKKCPTKSKVITTKRSLNDDYFDIGTSEETYDSVTIEHPAIDIADDIMMYWENKVGIFMYSWSDLSAMIIESESLHKTFKSLFNIIWDSNKKK